MVRGNVRYWEKIQPNLDGTEEWQKEKKRFKKEVSKNSWENIHLIPVQSYVQCDTENVLYF